MATKYKHKALDAAIVSCFTRVDNKTVEAHETIRDTFVEQMRAVANKVTKQFGNDVAKIKAYANQEFSPYYKAELDKDKSIADVTKSVKRSNAVKVVTCAPHVNDVLDAVIKNAKPMQNIESAFVTALTQIRGALNDKKRVTKTLINESAKGSLKTRKSAKAKPKLPTAKQLAALLLDDNRSWPESFEYLATLCNTFAKGAPSDHVASEMDRMADTFTEWSQGYAEE